MSNLSELLPSGGGQNVVSLTASGTIPGGQPVILNSDGTVSAVSSTTYSNAVGSDATASTMIADNTDVVAIGSNKVVFLYSGTSQYGYAVIGTISGTSISFGTPITFVSTAIELMAGAYIPESDRIVVLYGRSYNSHAAQSVVLTPSGTSLSAGSPTDASGGGAVLGNSIGVAYDPDQQKVLVSYAQGNGNYDLQTAVGELGSGLQNSVTYTAGSSIALQGRYTDIIYDTYANAAVMVYSDAYNNLKVGAGTVSGSVGSGDAAISFGTFVDVYTGGSAQNAFPSLGYDESANAFVVVYADESNSKYGTAKVGTVSGTTVTLGSASLVSGNQTFTSNRMKQVVYNALVQKTVVIWLDYSAQFLYSSVGTVSGTSISFATKYQIDDATSRYSAVYESTSQKIAVLHRNPSNYVVGFVYTAGGETTNLTSTNVIGLAAKAIANSAAGDINVFGGISTAHSGLTIGSDYYVQDDGRIASGVEYTAFDIASASFVDSFSVSSQASAPSGLAFNADGTKMYVSDDGNNNVSQYALTTGFDVSTSSFTQSFSVNSQDTQATGVAFNSDGSKMFVAGRTNSSVFEYALSSGFDISSALYTQAFSVSSQEGSLQDLAFNTDGTKLFICGQGSNKINEYALTTGFDVSTASFTQGFSVSDEESQVTGLTFNNDGTAVFIVGEDGDEINEYALSGAFNISTASFTQNFSISSQDTTPRAIRFSVLGTKIFVVGQAGLDVNEYLTSPTAFGTTVLAGQAISATTINMRNLT